ncbi:restriction endonuclease subunit S [Flaviaesturariibacter amylovorans]|uniref:Type I restriction modification DNA specificity domain-containing protein n=1 Tax=Flaviaesturariibacter amylovorans TaxID=1084520 RepID=A0ABP8H9Q7_9BACT
MELREVKKVSKVYMFPEDWMTMRLCDLADIVTGSTPPTHDLSNYGDEFLFASPADLGSSKYIDETEKKLSAKGFKYSRKFPKGSILFTCIGSTIGKSGMARFAITSNQQINAVLPNKNYNSDFLFYSLSYLSPSIKALAGEQAVPLINKTQFGLTWVTLPTLPEQAAIATALSDMDALIAQTETLIAKKKAIKQGVMQRLLSPVDADGKMKEGWVERRLGDCMSTSPQYGLNASATAFDQSLPAYLRITDITEDGKYSTKNIASVNSPLSSFFYLQKGDIVFARTGASVGKTYLYRISDGPLVFAGFLIRIQCDPMILLSEYLFYYTHSKPYYDWITANSMRSGQPGVNGNEYQELRFWMPHDVEEQLSTVKGLQGMSDEIDHLGLKVAKLSEMKQGMMQSLLTGKIRIHQQTHEPATTI